MLVPGEAEVPDDVGSQAAAPFSLGPIEGLTTDWHPAPDRIVVTVGAELTFECKVPEGGTVAWKGATEVDRSATASRAVCELQGPGTYKVIVEVTQPPAERFDRDREDPHQQRGAKVGHLCTIEAVDIRADRISWGSAQLVSEEIVVDRELSNHETMNLFFGPSIARLARIGERHYRTSTGRVLTFRANVDPPVFSSMVEWRINGKAVHIGAEFSFTNEDTGTRDIATGPADRSDGIRIESYEVTITNPTDKYVVQDTKQVTFRAETEPPGFESEVTWLASTKYGKASVVTAKGPTFTVRFDDTWGRDRSQWLGVKADNAIFNQDQWKRAPVFDDPPYQLYERILAEPNENVAIPATHGDILQIEFCPMEDTAHPYVEFDDFYATFKLSGDASVVSTTPGYYIVRVTMTGGQDLYEFDVTTPPNEGWNIPESGQPAWKKKKGGKAKCIATPTADLVLVEKVCPKTTNPDGSVKHPGDNKANDYAFQAYQDVGNTDIKRIDEVQEVIGEICDKYDELGRRVSVVVHAHGAGGMIAMGRGQKKCGNPGADEYISKLGFQRTKDFVAMLKGKITCLTLVSCEVGKDATNDPCPVYDGPCFLQDLANCLSDTGKITTVKAYDRTVRNRARSNDRDAKLSVVVDDKDDTPANHLVSKTGDPTADCAWD